MRVLLSLLIGAIPALFMALLQFGAAAAATLTPFLAAGVATLVIVSLYRLWYAPLSGQA